MSCSSLEGIFQVHLPEKSILYNVFSSTGPEVRAQIKHMHVTSRRIVASVPITWHSNIVMSIWTFWSPLPFSQHVILIIHTTRPYQANYYQAIWNKVIILMLTKFAPPIMIDNISIVKKPLSYTDLIFYVINSFAEYLCCTFLQHILTTERKKW